MMTKESKVQETEQRILETAERVFYLKGKDGTSMQDIADEAGITRTSLNYYYRSKDKLFEAAFQNTMKKFVPQVVKIIQEKMELRDLVIAIVHTIIDAMIENPQIPVFVLQEMSANPKRIPQMMTEFGVDFGEYSKDVEMIGANDQLTIDPRHLLMNTVSLIIFPFAAKPIIREVMFGGDDEAYLAAMKERKELIPEIVDRMIKTYSK